MIELTGLTKAYGNHTVLKDVNLLIQAGEIFGIIGKSGAGKSTLLRCINLLEQPDEGHIWVDRQDLTQLNTAQLRVARHKMAMIFQQFNLLNAKTVYENIALPMRIQGLSEPQINQKINELLPLVELTDKVHMFPSQLSGGQKQRVAIARALSCDPKILLCDEATSALDPATTDAILALLKKINQLYGITIVLITHEMDVVKRICNRLALIDQGEIIETNTLANVFLKKDSPARQLLYTQLIPSLPHSLLHQLSSTPTDRPIIRLLFEGEGATVPFISQISREMQLDINILLANIDRFDALTCGVLVIELHVNPALLATFVQRCQQANLHVEILGYVTDHVL